MAVRPVANANAFNIGMDGLAGRRVANQNAHRAPPGPVIACPGTPAIGYR